MKLSEVFNKYANESNIAIISSNNFKIKGKVIDTIEKLESGDYKVHFKGENVPYSVYGTP